MAMTIRTLPGALLALVVALVGLWTGWIGAVLVWVAGHLGDAITGSVEHLTG